MSDESNGNTDADSALRRRVLFGGVLALASGAVLGGAANAFAGTNAAFRWCRRCQGLWRPGAGDNGHCPVSHWWDHSHYVDGSGVYWFVDQGGDYSHDGRTNGNLDMKWCRTCKAAYWDAGGPTLCPNNSRGHTPSPETYRVETSRDFNPRYRHQAGWRACQNCFGYFFIGNGLGRTHCATGRWHVPLTVNRREVELLPRYGNPPTPLTTATGGLLRPGCDAQPGAPQRLPGLRTSRRTRPRLRLTGPRRRHPESPTPRHRKRDRSEIALINAAMTPVH